MMDMYPYVPPAYHLPSSSSSKPKPTHAHSFAATPSSSHYTPLPLSHTAPAHASSSRNISSTPITPLTPRSPRSSSTSSHTSGKRPKMAKKAHSSSTAKQRGVQASLEKQVDKYGGWHAFFLPAKPVPNVPPCSPVLGATRVEVDMDEEGEMHMDGRR